MKTASSSFMCPASLGTVLYLITLYLSFCLQSWGQNYSVDWYKISGGGGSSSGGYFSVSGTIGQHDASAPLTGGTFSVTGGFWALINVVQTPGAPALYISRGANSVTVYWQNVSGWNLIQSGNLATPVASWSASSAPTLANGTNSLTLVNPAGNLFFRLKNP
jgi:hypothetical protein